jgi:hypothetical protein
MTYGHLIQILVSIALLVYVNTCKMIAICYQLDRRPAGSFMNLPLVQKCHLPVSGTYPYRMGTSCSCLSPHHHHARATILKIALLSFGGISAASCYNDVWSFDTFIQKWSRLECTGSPPSPREGHAAALVGDVIYVFGGRRADGRHLSGLFALVITSKSLYQLPNSLPPLNV